MKTLLVALDFSSVTEELLKTAENMAGENAKVYFLHVAAPDPDFVGLGVGPEYVRDERAEILRGEHEKLAKYKSDFLAKGINAEALLVAGPTVQTILEEAKKLNADLLIIGKKGHSVIYELIIGSVCQGVVEKITIPTLIIPVPNH